MISVPISSIGTKIVPIITTLSQFAYIGTEGLDPPASSQQKYLAVAISGFQYTFIYDMEVVNIER